MSDALKRAKHYRDLARRHLRLAASTENPNHYLRIAVRWLSPKSSAHRTETAISTLTDLT
jgi:hypothetical protein